MRKQSSHERQPGSKHGSSAEAVERGRRLIAERGLTIRPDLPPRGPADPASYEHLRRVR